MLQYLQYMPLAGPVSTFLIVTAVVKNNPELSNCTSCRISSGPERPIHMTLCWFAEAVEAT